MLKVKRMNVLTTGSLERDKRRRNTDNDGEGPGPSPHTGDYSGSHDCPGNDNPSYHGRFNPSHNGRDSGDDFV
ncbi:UNVERIFIED_CONTAM: hypothetical protein K2H54_001819 [Gekko kuhli]